jgi:hypothetical protein
MATTDPARLARERRRELIAQMARAMYDAENAGQPRDLTPPWLAASADTWRRYSDMAATALRIVEASGEPH